MGLWFCSIRFLGVEAIFYSVAMATEFIRRLNEGFKGEAS